MVELAERVRLLQRQGCLELALPAGGATSRRHQALLQFGRIDLSLARLVEAHTDAIAILAEAGRAGQLNALYGVWASDGPHSQVLATAAPDGSWYLDGLKQYCSGATIVDVAMLTAHAADGSGLLLFEMPMHLSGVNALASAWASPALADTATVAVALTRVKLPSTALIGDPGWYLERPGFWHGAIGPAACWAGGATGLIEAAASLNRKDAHSRAQVGALHSIAWGLEAVLLESGRQIDAQPQDAIMARQRALKVRHLIERWCTETMDRFGRATGPQLLAMDAQVARQYAALTVYIRQCHGERDLEGIA